jgi:hypothetical protein
VPGADPTEGIMHVAVQQLSREQALARWAELCDDPELAMRDAPVEIGEFGEPYMTPPPSLRHRLLAGATAQQLRARLGTWRTACAKRCG